MAGRSDIQAGKAHVEIYVKNSALVQGLRFAQDKLQGLGKSIMRIGAGFTAMGAAILGPLAAAVGQFIAVGGALDDMSSRTGIARTVLGELKFAAEQSGASLDDVEKATKKMAKVITDADRGLKSAKDSLGLLGLTADDLKGKLPDEQLQIIADRLAAIDDPTTRTAAAIELLGKSGTNLLPMVGQLRELRAEAVRLGLAPTEESSKLADALGDAFDAVKSVVGATAYEIGAALAPALLPVLTSMKEIAGAVNLWVRENAGLIRTVAMIGVGLVAAGAIITAIGAGIFALGTAAGLAATAVTMLGAVVGFLTSPVTLVVAAIAAGVFAWARFTESGRASVQALIDFFAPLLETARTAIAGIGDALMSGDLTLAGQIAVTALKLIFLQGLNAIADMMGGTLGAVIKTIGVDLIQGDLAGVWDTVVKGMAMAWDAFALGIVSAFQAAINLVAGLWNTLVAGIRVSIGVLQSAAASLGQQGIADALGKVNEGVGAIGATGSAALSVGSAAAGAVAADRQRRAAQSAFDFAGKIGAGSAESDAKVEALTKELAALREQAAQAREAAGLKREELAAPDVAGLRGESSTVTFSGAALLAAGQGGGPQQQMLRELKAQKAIQAKQLAAQLALSTNINAMLRYAP